MIAAAMQSGFIRQMTQKKTCEESVLTEDKMGGLGVNRVDVSVSLKEPATTSQLWYCMEKCISVCHQKQGSEDVYIYLQHETAMI